MTTIDKGRIITAPILGTIFFYLIKIINLSKYKHFFKIKLINFLGSCFGPFFWGFLADVKGRKFALLIAIFLQGNCELLMSIVQNYWGFLILKFFSGLG